ncbi:hypothetical protein C2845_PM14G21530 [Panicum miliaceum]|uniref:FBD domain-containing protein n=1 Tax=Panicum miliaceum TaxID=4540 RepID=A0A3L6PME0_PANMI|nr:hypothetical protein C2845_PM14G21530 [Panicum miliaceum]
MFSGGNLGSRNGRELLALVDATCFVLLGAWALGIRGFEAIAYTTRSQGFCECILWLMNLLLNALLTTQSGTVWPKCFCDAVAYSDKCEIHRKVALELLEEVEITGFTGADEEMKLVSMLFQSPNSIKHMALRGDAIGRRHLMKVPSTSSDRGCWNLAEQVLNWTCYAPESATLVD